MAALACAVPVLSNILTVTLLPGGCAKSFLLQQEQITSPGVHLVEGPGVKRLLRI